MQGLLNPEQKLLHHLADPVIGIDAHGTLVAGNAAAWRLCALAAPAIGLHWTAAIGAGAPLLGRIGHGAGSRQQLIRVRGCWHWMRCGGGPPWVVQLTPCALGSPLAEPLEHSEPDRSPDFVCRLDPGGRFRSVNSAVRNILGYEPSDLVGSSIADFIVAEDIDRTRREAEEIRAGGGTIGFENRYRHRNGGLVHLMWTTRWSKEDESFHCVGRDITELRETIRRLRRSEQHYASLFQHHPDATFSLDRSGRFTSVNAAAVRVAGIPATRMLQMDFRDIVVDGADHAETTFAHALAGLPQTAQLRGRRSDGTLYEVRATAVPIVIDGVVEGIHGIARDITEQNRTLERLRLLEACVAALNDCVLIIEVPDPRRPEPRIRYANPAFERMTGYTTAEILGKSPGALWGAQVGQEVLAQMRASLLRQESMRTELARQAKDGRRFWTEIEVVPVPGEEGRPLHIVAVERDITERKHHEAREAESARKQRAIAETALHILGADNLEAVLQKITDTAREIVGAHQAATSVVSDQDWSRSVTMLSLSDKYAAYRTYDAQPDGSGIYAWAARQNRPLRMTDAELRAHPHWRNLGEHVAAHPPLRGWLAAPLLDRSGQNVGLVQLTDKCVGDFDEQDEALLVQLAQLASVAIENARLIEELATAEAQYRSIFRNALEGIIRCDAAGILFAANPSFAYLLGYPDLPTLLLSARSLADLFEDPAEWSQIAAHLECERAVSGCVVRLRRRDGRCIWAMLSLRSNRNGDSMVIDGMVQDVTDRHEAEGRVRALNAELEARVAERTRELAESEALQRILMDVAPQVVWVSAPDGEVRYFNRRWREVSGRSAEDSLGWRWTEALHPEDVAGVRARWAEALRQRGRFETECRIRSGEGSYRHYLYVAHPVPDANGGIGYWIGIAADVSDLKHAEEALAQSNRELEAFSYSVSHDLRTPLHAISGFGGALLRTYRDRLDAQAVHYLERISANCERMAQQIEDILNLARVSRVELRRQAVDLSALAERAARNLRVADPARIVEIAIEPGLMAQGDPALLRLVIENLLGNAWKFTARRADARIELVAAELPGEQLFSIGDNGVGFDMAYAGKLFGVFQRLHHASEFPGTGVGLATVRRIIERHRGRIWAEAAVDQGARFHFTLPL